MDAAVRLGRQADLRVVEMMEVRFASVAAPGRTNENYALAVGKPRRSFRRRDRTRWRRHWLYPRPGMVRTPPGVAVRRDHTGQCDLANPATPASTVCALKV